MVKYHINPESGEPGVCRAEKACRFGAPAAEHYVNAEEARAGMEEMYEAFERDQGLDENTPLWEKKMYEGWLMAVEYNDSTWARADEVSAWLASQDDAEFTIEEDPLYDEPQLKLSPELLYDEDADNTPEIKINIITKRNRVNYQTSINGEVRGESSIVDVNSGAQMKEYINEVVEETFSNYENGDYDEYFY